MRTYEVELAESQVASGERPSILFRNRDVDGVDKISAQSGHLFWFHKAILKPEPIIHSQRFVFFDRVFEIGSEPAIFSFAEPGLLRIGGVVEVGHGVSFVAKDK